MLRFNSHTGLYVDDESVIRDEVRELWKRAFRGGGLPELDTAPETPAGQLIDSQTAAIGAKDAQLLYLANQFNPATADGRWQDALAKIYRIDRHVAQPTAVTCVCTGLAGTFIPKGALVKTSGNVTLVCVNDTMISPDGTASVLFTARETGAVEVAANTATSIVTAVAGWDSVTNPVAGVTGRAAETRAEFERRRLASVAVNSQGSVAALYGGVANIDGVAACIVLENDTNDTVRKFGAELTPHSVLISVYGGEDSKIAETIYRKKNAGCAMCGDTVVTYVDAESADIRYSFRILRPKPVALGVRVMYTRVAGTPANIESIIKKSIITNFNGEIQGRSRVSMASSVYASRFIASLETSGIQELVSVEISLPVGEKWGSVVTVSAAEIPTLSADDIVILPLGGA